MKKNSLDQFQADLQDKENLEIGNNQLNIMNLNLIMEILGKLKNKNLQYQIFMNPQNRN